MEIPIIKILLIEDDEEDYILLQRLLGRVTTARYQIAWETTYEAGLARMQSGEHDLCLLDYFLGSRNGIELIQEARQRGYMQPIVLLTGAENSEIDIQALQAGADDYIAKGQLQGALLHRVIRYAIERKKAEHERERLLREQIETKELEQRRLEFINIVVHELKTPLTSLKGYGQLLQRRLAAAGNSQWVQTLMSMEAQVNRLTGLIDDLRDIAQFGAGKFQFHESDFAFDALVEETIEAVQLTTETHKILYEGRTHRIIRGDRDRIGQVIINFLTNAIKYAPDTEAIYVRTGVTDDAVTLCVEDFGPGIPLEKQSQLFDPFYRVLEPNRGPVPGLGLGLYIASEIIKQHEGKIWLESEEGKGTKFYFSLPPDRVRSEEAQEAETAMPD